MEDTNNFESQLKRKLEERTITPSENAWNRVANRTKKKKKNVSPFYWIAAAAVIGFGFYLVQQNEQAPQPQIVIIEKEIPVRAIQPEEEVIVKEELAEAPKLIENDTPNIAVEPNRQLRSEVAVSLTPNAIAESQKVNEIVAQVVERQKSGDEITEELVDAMIEKSRREIAAESLTRKSATDATALLNDAEKDLDRSFKDRIFEALQKKIKIAFSNP